MKIFISILFSFLVLNFYAQNPVHYFLNSDNNFPTNEIYSIAENQEGKIYFGSNIGLISYDGINSTVINSDVQNSRAVSFLKAIHQNIWCKNFLGQLYQVGNNRLTIVQEIATSNPNIPFFTENQFKETLLATKDELFILDQKNNKRIHKKLSFSFPNEEIISIESNKQEWLILTSKARVLVYDRKLNIVKSINVKKLEKGQIIQANSRFVKNKNDIYIYIEYVNEVAKYERKLLSFLENKIQFKYYFQRYLSENERVVGCEIIDDKCWLYGDKGIKAFQDGKLVEH